MTLRRGHVVLVLLVLSFSSEAFSAAPILPQSCSSAPTNFDNFKKILESATAKSEAGFCKVSQVANGVLKRCDNGDEGVLVIKNKETGEVTEQKVEFPKDPNVVQTLFYVDPNTQEKMAYVVNKDGSVNRMNFESGKVESAQLPTEFKDKAATAEFSGDDDSITFKENSKVDASAAVSKSTELGKSEPSKLGLGSLFDNSSASKKTELPADFSYFSNLSNVKPFSRTDPADIFDATDSPLDSEQTDISCDVLTAAQQVALRKKGMNCIRPAVFRPNSGFFSSASQRPVGPSSFIKSFGSFFGRTYQSFSSGLIHRWNDLVSFAPFSAPGIQDAFTDAAVGAEFSPKTPANSKEHRSENLKMGGSDIDRVTKIESPFSQDPNLANDPEMAAALDRVLKNIDFEKRSEFETQNDEAKRLAKANAQDSAKEKDVVIDNFYSDLGETLAPAQEIANEEEGSVSKVFDIDLSEPAKASHSPSQKSKGELPLELTQIPAVLPPRRKFNFFVESK